MVVAKERLVPGWSPEIANELIRLAAIEERQFDQLQLQALVYIAHGWSLAQSNVPLTGDRPEAWAFGPMYRRMANALAPFGQDPVSREISEAETFPEGSWRRSDHPVRSDLDDSERALLELIYKNYGFLESWQLSALTRKGDTPWRHVYAGGAGKSRDIPHDLIRAQFVELLRRSQEER